jgi:hypothetical protein
LPTVAVCGVPLVAVTVAGTAAALVRLKLAVVDTPTTVAVTVYAPDVPLAVNADDVATPLELVVAVVVRVAVPAKVPLAPVAGAVNVTTIPLTGCEPLSSTVADSGAANAVLMAVLCGVPLVAVMVAGGAAVFVRLKLAGVDTPATVAVTLYAPDVPLAVNAGEVAIPLVLVVAVTVPVVEPAKVPLAPVAGAVKVTTAPFTGCDPLSSTVATNGAVKAVLTTVVCGVPLEAVMVAGVDALLVRLNVAGFDTPDAVAVTG